MTPMHTVLHVKSNTMQRKRVLSEITEWHCSSSNTLRRRRVGAVSTIDKMAQRSAVYWMCRHTCTCTCVKWIITLWIIMFYGESKKKSIRYIAIRSAPIPRVPAMTCARSSIVTRRHARWRLDREMLMCFGSINRFVRRLLWVGCGC